MVDKAVKADAPEVKPAPAAGKSNADVKSPVQDMLDPSKPEAAEAAPAPAPNDDVIGDSYPTDEALENEKKAREKMLDDKAKKEADEAAKDLPKNEVRSAIDANHTSVVHPNALDEKPAKK